MSDDTLRHADVDTDGERPASPIEDPPIDGVVEERSILSLASTSSSDLEPERRNREADADSYVPPLQDPYDKALKYLEKHNILQLFQNITSGIVYNQPVDPLEYMELEIEKVQELERHRNHKIKRKTTPKTLVQEGKDQTN